MPVIIIKARQGVLKTGEMKAKLISGVAEAFAQAVGDETYRERATVIIEETPNENWGLKGRSFVS